MKKTPEELKEHIKKYQREYARIWRKKNKQKQKRIRRQERLRNREKIALEKREYRRSRIFKVSRNGLKSLSKTKDYASAFDLWSLWHKQKGCCALTGRRLKRDNCHLDHIIPIARGGGHTKGNLQWLHKDVNWAKRAMLNLEFIQLCKEVVARTNA